MNHEKAYKDALERAREIHNEHRAQCFDVMVKVFPELKESEDEKMREMAIKAIYAPEAQSCIKSWGINPDDVIAWLEKQGEKANIHQDTEDDLRRQSTIQVLEYARSLDAYNQYGKESINKDIAWLEKQGERKPIISNNALREGIAHFGITQYQIDNWLKKYVDVENLI